ncbi:PRTRC system protein B [Sphingobium yanoikuyae]|uniref:PRTRC system protein B n=1 Tax=Sphingobium yanoikuyae TaxID=13690 RepID=A0A3G2UQR6_SPHYA|nr:PRTRC system protein B [Sphingobium yanoikuyae]AYO76408.1 PRTRC system protein B [Sphingobium yanoikuyae]
MPNHSTQFDATPGGMVLTNAILLYGAEGRYGASREGGAAFASIHEVEHRDAGPMIAAGTPLTRAHLRQWTKALDRAAPPEILPANVLVAHADLIAWWVPAQVRLAYFDLSRTPEGLKVLNQRTSVPVPYPPQLFVASRKGFGVYALPADERPTAETKLLHSPVLNVYLTGQLCWGNIARPKALTVASMPEYERAIFESWSTHPNVGQELTVTGRGGLVKLWDNLAASRSKRFPVKRLKPFNPNSNGKALKVPVTFGSLIASKVAA